MRTLSFAIPGIPIPQARARHRVVKLRNGSSFVGQYDPAESRIWKATVAEFAAKARNGGAPFEGPIVLECVFVFPPTASWSQKRMRLLETMEIPKITRPDLKNLIAGVEDGANGILWRDDGQIWSYGNSRKIFGVRPEVRITVTAVDSPEVKTQMPEAMELLPAIGGAR